VTTSKEILMKNIFSWISPDIIDKTTHFKRVADKKAEYAVPELTHSTATTVGIDNELGLRPVNLPNHRQEPGQEFDLIQRWKTDILNSNYYTVNIHFQGHVYFNAATYYTDIQEEPWEVPRLQAWQDNTLHSHTREDFIVRLPVRSTKYPYPRAIQKRVPTAKDTLLCGWALSKKGEYHNTAGGILTRSKNETDPSVTIILGYGHEAKKYKVSTKDKFLPPNYCIRLRNTTYYGIRKGVHTQIKQKTILEICSEAAAISDFPLKRSYSDSDLSETTTSESNSESY
jgi:hypothetical protein